MFRLTLLAIVGLALACGRADAYSVDFVTFDGIDYMRMADGAGRPLERADLGPEFAVVKCNTTQASTCADGDDKAAALLPGGTRVYAVRGYKTSFRLAAVVGEEILVFESWRSARAKTGADLYDIAGRVHAIDVRRVSPGNVVAPATAMISHRADVDALAAMIERASFGPPRQKSVGHARYWLTFWLTDGTTLARAYFPETGELTGGLALPPEFRETIERHLPARK